MGGFTSAVVKGVTKGAKFLGSTKGVSAVGTGLDLLGMFKSGNEAQDASNYNAAIYMQQSAIIDKKKDLTNQQYNRKFRQVTGQSVVAVSSSGYDLSGSFLAVLNDRLTQVELDRQSAIYNLEIEKITAESNASEQRRDADRAKSSSLYDMGASLLTQGNEWYQKYGGFGKGKSPSGQLSKKQLATQNLLNQKVSGLGNFSLGYP